MINANGKVMQFIIGHEAKITCAYFTRENGGKAVKYGQGRVNTNEKEWDGLASLPLGRDHVHAASD